MLRIWTFVANVPLLGQSLRNQNFFSSRPPLRIIPHSILPLTTRCKPFLSPLMGTLENAGVT